MGKQIWFKFYYGYRQAFAELPFWKCRKLLFAIIDYVATGGTAKLDKKTLKYFMGIKEVIDADRMIAVKNGVKGSKKRWKNKDDRVSIRKNRGSIVVRKDFFEEMGDTT